MKTILIIGGGYSGAVTAALLLQNKQSYPLRILLLNGSGRVARGMAYGTQSPDHTLNVPVGNMSAFDDIPHHFLDFLQSSDASVTSASFVARSRYGDYLEHMLNEAERSAPPHISLERIYCNVTRLSPSEDGQNTIAHLESGRILEVQKVVLAIGHFPSTEPRIHNADFYRGARYIRDPWDQAKLNDVDPDSDVLLIGTGLTSVDVALTLHKQSTKRKIFAVSRRGVLPQYHRQVGGASRHAGDINEIWGSAATILGQMRALRQYCAQVESKGGDWRDALAMLRPVTSEIWRSYNETERRRFVRHVQPYWDSHRHRLAPIVANQLDILINEGKFVASAARLVNLQEKGAMHVEVTMQPRGKESLRTLRVGHVVNCTGPCTSLYETGNPLVRQLLDDGLIRADSLGLGLDVSDTCATIDIEGKAARHMYYIGPWLKAKYWEATAVPDLRRIASRLVQTLLAT